MHDVPVEPGDVVTAVEAALVDGHPQVLDDLLEPLALETLPVALLNELLVADLHHQHQRVAFALQRAGDPSTVPYVAQALARGFSHLRYTGSGDGVIAKWYSWLLAGIGTPDAIALLRQHAESENREVAIAMDYRLARLRRDGGESESE